MFKVAITDYTFPSLEIEEGILGEAGCTVVGGQCKTPELLIPLVADADAVITQFAPVTAEIVNAMEKARVIVRYGIGFDNVACDVARERGIPVCNVPDYCIDEVADHTLAFILSMTRRLRANCTHMVKGQWGLGVSLAQMRALRDQTVGVVGLGRIGRAVVERLRPFKPTILVTDPVVSVEEVAGLGGTLVGIEELLTTSDIVTLHCPSTEVTRDMINAESIQTMKSGSILINVGRGNLVELDALTTALQSGHIAAAALDVFEPEPLPVDSALLSMDNVVVSSHIASASLKAVTTLRESVAKIALAALRGEMLPNIVNGVVVGH
ncbi:MAG: C-terminal binding protein [Planctomycetales bacterium]|nr:C-terminal binding protein [Planctomycetales bacterium]